MSDLPLEIGPCPPELTREALSLVLSAMGPEQRREITRDVVDSLDHSSHGADGLIIARRDGALCGAAWGQLQPGNTAVLWPPQWETNGGPQASAQMSRAVAATLDAAGIAMTQALLPSRDSEVAPALECAGFRHFADLLYLVAESATFPKRPPVPSAIQIEAFQARERARLSSLIERTYEGTLDCAELNGVRQMEDVINGYAATGVTGNSHWYIIRAEERDVGVLLLAEHAGPRYWELMYLGLVPEVRHRGWGVQIARNAQWLAYLAKIERIVLAVDAANIPALRLYERCGFVKWDRRSVFVRTHGGSPGGSHKL